jgi:hypothetical protein
MNTKSTLTLLVGILLLGSPPLRGQVVETPTKDHLELSRELLGKYYETQRLLAKEKADWKLGKEIMTTRIAMIEAQIEEMKAKTKEEQGKVTESDKKRDELRKEDAELEKTAEIQEEGITKLEARVHKLWPLLPDYVKTNVGGQYDRLPKPGSKKEDIKSSLSERYLNVLIVLTEVNKFHTNVTILNERRKLADGSEMEVETIYFGLAAAYFAAGEGDTAVGGKGLPGPKGWEWEEDPSMAPAIQSIISMNQGGELAEFINIPVTVR